MNNIIFYSRSEFENSLFPEIKDNITPLTKNTKIESNTDYVVFERDADNVKEIFSNIIKLDQTNIRVKFVISHPCIACSISRNPENRISLDYFLAIKKCIDAMKSLFNAKFEVLKFEDLHENCTVDYNKYLSIEDSKYFDPKRYEQLIDLCRYLPKEENPMSIFGYNEIPLSIIMKPDEELAERRDVVLKLLS